MRLGSDCRTVRHFWYDSWPDHGVPDTADPLLEMMHFAEDWEGSAEAIGHPWTVHCSAGIGRTGAFLAIDLGVRKLEQGEEINVIDIIRCGGLIRGLIRGLHAANVFLELGLASRSVPQRACPTPCPLGSGAPTVGVHCTSCTER